MCKLLNYSVLLSGCQMVMVAYQSKASVFYNPGMRLKIFQTAPVIVIDTQKIQLVHYLPSCINSAIKLPDKTCVIYVTEHLCN